MGPIGKWISDPNVSLAFNAAQGLTAAGASLMSRPGKSSSAGSMYSSAEPMFAAAQQAQQDAMDAESGLADEQASLMLDEAYAEAGQKAREVRRMQENQALAYSGAGVLMEGSPLLVLEETRRLGQEEIDAILRRGAAQASITRRKSAIGMAQGRASLLGDRAAFESKRTQAMLDGLQTKAGGVSPITSAFSSLFGNSGGMSTPRSTTPKAPPKRKLPKGAGDLGDPLRYTT